MKKRNLLHLLLVILVGLTLALAGCDDGDDGDPGPPGPPGPPGGDPDEIGSLISQWQESGHADATSPAFNDWNAEGEVPVRCARCHSPSGFVSYALDGIIEEPAPTGGVIGCNACHSSTLYADFYDFDMAPGEANPVLEPVVFPSGLTATLNGPSNMCMVCHQGRASTVQVNNAIAQGTPGSLSFINIHYYAAAASLFGTEVKGGYEYEGKSYVGQFGHVPSRDSCVECHMGENINHTFEPQPEDCARCHDDVDPNADFEDDTAFRDIRRGSPADYDGDGNTTEGLYFEINDTLSPALLQEIQTYAQTTLGLNVAYDPANYPYWFVDANANGVIDEGETQRFGEFDAPLLRAAYNYQVIQKEPCGYIHNAKYMIQLLYDSIEALGGDVSQYVRPEAVDETGAQGIIAEWEASGHSDVLAEAFNHWNPTEAGVPAGFVAGDEECAQCHNPDGFRDYAEDGTVDDEYPITEGDLVTETIDGVEVTHVTEDLTITCRACHVLEGEIAVTTDPTTLYGSPDFPALEPVTFPSGLTATLNGPSNMCMACHQGRASKQDVDEAIAQAAGASPPFVNIHYYAVAASLFGTQVQGGYEYDGMTYVGQNTFPAHQSLAPELTTCVGCHMGGVDEADHTFNVQLGDCTQCHPGASFETLAGSPGTNKVEIDQLSVELLSEIQAYASTTIGTPIVYSPNAYPYFFVDTNSNGTLDEGEAAFPNRYQSFDATLLKAAYNFQVAQKEPCGYIHNGAYIKQLLYDSIVDLGGTPPVTPVGRGDGTQPPPSGAPTANAGADQTDVAIGTPVNLDASASTDPQGDTLSFSWTLQAPTGSTATLTGADTATPTFTPDVAGTYTATVTVSDGTNTATDSVTITTAGTTPQAPDVVTYPDGALGAITFSHTDHANTFLGGNCAACHTQSPPGPITVDGATTAHAFCGQCHTQVTAGPCNFCHGN